jgi:hypothetical protein
MPVAGPAPGNDIFAAYLSETVTTLGIRNAPNVIPPPAPARALRPFLLQLRPVPPYPAANTGVWPAGSPVIQPQRAAPSRGLSKTP